MQQIASHFDFFTVANYFQQQNAVSYWVDSHDDQQNLVVRLIEINLSARNTFISSPFLVKVNCNITMIRAVAYASVIACDGMIKVIRNNAVIYYQEVLFTAWDIVALESEQ